MTQSESQSSEINSELMISKIEEYKRTKKLKSIKDDIDTHYMKLNKHLEEYDRDYDEVSNKFIYPSHSLSNTGCWIWIGNKYERSIIAGTVLMIDILIRKRSNNILLTSLKNYQNISDNIWRKTPDGFTKEVANNLTDIVIRENKMMTKGILAMAGLIFAREFYNDMQYIGKTAYYMLKIHQLNAKYIKYNKYGYEYSSDILPRKFKNNIFWIGAKYWLIGCGISAYLI
jgi:hypothetical protein